RGERNARRAPRRPAQGRRGQVEAPLLELTGGDTKVGIRTKGGARRYMKLAAALASLLFVGIFVSAALADGSSSSTSPTVATDKAAYVPGDTVHVTGAGWLPNESVHLHVAANSHSFAFDSHVVASV